MRRVDEDQGQGDARHPTCGCGAGACRFAGKRQTPVGHRGRLGKQASLTASTKPGHFTDLTPFPLLALYYHTVSCNDTKLYESEKRCELKRSTTTPPLALNRTGPGCAGPSRWTGTSMTAHWPCRRTAIPGRTCRCWEEAAPSRRDRRSVESRLRTLTARPAFATLMLHGLRDTYATEFRGQRRRRSPDGWATRGSRSRSVSTATCCRAVTRARRERSLTASSAPPSSPSRTPRRPTATSLASRPQKSRDQSVTRKETQAMPATNSRTKTAGQSGCRRGDLNPQWHKPTRPVPGGGYPAQERKSPR